MKIIAISGDGAGAGKTYAARVFGGMTQTIADQIRHELQKQYPTFNWYDRTQKAKDQPVPNYGSGGLTMRQVLTVYGQQFCEQDPCYWVRKTVRGIQDLERIEQYPPESIAIDDVRKTCEINYLRENFKDVVHIHVENPEAVVEPMFEAESLKRSCDYVVKWRR